MKYEKIIKWVLAILFLAGAVLSVYGFIAGWPTKDQIGDLSTHFPVDLILGGAYAFAGITVLAVAFGVFVIGGINNPKSLIKLLLGVVAIVAIVGGAWVLAPGSPALGLVDKVPTAFELKLTDATLTLTYLLSGATLLALVAGWVIGATRK